MLIRNPSRYKRKGTLRSSPGTVGINIIYRKKLALR